MQPPIVEEDNEDINAYDVNTEIEREHFPNEDRNLQKSFSILDSRKVRSNSGVNDAFVLKDNDEGEDSNASKLKKRLINDKKIVEKRSCNFQRTIRASFFSHYQGKLSI